MPVPRGQASGTPPGKYAGLGVAIDRSAAEGSTVYTMKQREIINVVGPALRGLLAEGQKLPRVRLDSTPAEDAPVFDPGEEKDTQGLVDRLRRWLAEQPRPCAVSVPEIGTFHVSPPPGEGRAGGKVAVVTGSARGFGLEIASALVSEGATVILGDVNVQGAEKAAASLREQHGEDRAYGILMNVTDADSVRTALDDVVGRLGGFDILISNAGILRADSVKTQPVEDFAFVTSVNYTGYFICVREAAPILATQHLACSTYRSDIIQINSKSGLSGSNRNAAYAGSKFGGVGLTQSFALELIEDGIKVNSICPGNFFDGPLWSDPDTGLLVQYLRAGKVPGAQTVEDVRHEYEAKVPMGRGCTTADVMKAVFYVVEQDYETGQAVPVTGGQVMLR